MRLARFAAAVAALTLAPILFAAPAVAGDGAASDASQLAQAPAPAPARPQADDDRVLRLCNHTNRTVEVAKAAPVGRNAGDGRPLVESRGWFPLAPGQCLTLYGPGLAQRYYYYYVQSESGTWTGQYPVCVSNRAFTIVDAQCGEGYMRRNFTQVDMGSTSGSFTVNLR